MYGITDPGAPSSTVQNTRAVLSSGLCGLGRTGIDANLWHAWVTPSAHQNSCDAAALRISSVLAEMAEVQQKQAAKNLKIKLGHNPDDAVNATVTCELYMVQTRVPCCIWHCCCNAVEKWGSARLRDPQ